MNRRIALLLVPALLLAAAGLAIFYFQSTSAPVAAPVSADALPAEITVAQAAALQAEGAYMLDVRQPDEWTAVHMPGANLIPLDQLSSRLSEVPAGTPIVVVCRSGNRSRQGRDILLQAGFSQVTSMAGGMNDWAANGLPTGAG
jgi:rhodanese-related sulfurtransferase